MTTDAAAAVPPPRRGRIRGVGAALIVVLALLIGQSPRFTAPLREAWFDAYQRAFPRQPGAMPAVVVEIDGRSLSTFGRWPWPRSLLADLVARIGSHGPAVLGIDILMPEPDPLSPERLLQGSGTSLAGAALPWAGLPTNDALLARAVAATPTVLAVAGMPEATGRSLRSVPFALRQTIPEATPTGLDDAPIARYAGALISVEPVNEAATGWGLVSADAVDGVIRTVPAVADLDGTLLPAFAIEMLRVAAGASSLRLVMTGAAVQGVAVGRVFVPTDRDGTLRPHFSLRRAERFVSAADVLDARVEPDRLRQKLVLLAVTGLGLGEVHATPVGERMPGSEIHAQLLENLYEGTLLARPPWSPLLEATVFAALAALLAWSTPWWAPRQALALALGCVLFALAGGFAAFVSWRLLLDAATPALGLTLVFGALLVSTLTESMRHRRALECSLQRQREQHARLAGELDAARRIQTAMLPRVELLGADRRLDLAATMLPAREVGGDLYDFFRLDDRRLFLLVGDVAGKGLSASIFMAVSKALCKSAALRTGAPDPGALMVAANAEVSRDNPELLFVTAFAAVLDLDTGWLEYCNAGHENPFRVGVGEGSVTRLADGDGPPLCAVEDFVYRGARLRLAPGELLCVVTDGVTEAPNPAAELYGGARVAAFLRLRCSCAAHALVEALVGDVARFSAGTAQFDDITVLALRWHGPRAGD